jgi:hypothetical protein
MNMWVGMSRAVADSEGMDGTAKRKSCAYQRDALSSFFSVRSVISTPVCGENAHHVVLPAGRLVTDSPTEIHI